MEPGQVTRRAILVVDDEEGILQVARLGLELNGFEVHTAATGLDALQEFRDRADALSLVLLDLSMPDLSGREVFRLMREHALCPVLFNSGFQGELRITQELEQPHTGFLEKPWTITRLLGAVQEMLSQGSPAPERRRLRCPP